MPNPTDAELKALIDAAIPDSVPGESKAILTKTINDLLNQLVDGLGLRIPPGGTEGQVLVKSSDSDFDVEWADAAATPTLTAPGLVVTAGNAQLSVAITPDVNATSTVVEASSDNFATIAGSTSGGSSPLVITGLTNGVAYKVRGHSTAPGYNQSPTTNASGTYTPSAGAGLTFHFGETVDGSVPDIPTIEALEAQAVGPMNITFSNNGVDEWRCFAYPDTETDPTTYYIGPLDNGTLGSGGTFAAPVHVAPYKVIMSNYPTTIIDPVQFS